MSQTISMYRGNDRTVSLTIIKTDGTAYNLTGCTIQMIVKQDINDLDAEAILTFDGTITGAANGVVEFYIVPADTSSITTLKDNVPYPCDFEVTTATGEKYTVLRTAFVLLKK